MYYKVERNGTVLQEFNDWGTQPKEIFWESNYPGSNQCLHIKAEPVDHTVTQYPNGTAHDVTFRGGTYLKDSYDIEFQLKDILEVGVLYEEFIGKYNQLNWGKLPTSSEFSLIQFFAELDDTLAIFTKKFWSSLSYGSFTWGVIPFVNDVKALLQTIENLSTDLSRIKYEDEFKISGEYQTEMRQISYSFTVRFTGFIDMSDTASEAAILLDRLGFHPDIATVWDLVPLSFLVDYILPVGRFLEGISDRGWVKRAHFSGWKTLKGTVNKKSKAHSPQDDWESIGDYDIFIRVPTGVDIEVEQNTRPPWFELPTFREIFNILYVLMSRR